MCGIDVCSEMLYMFYKSVVESALLYAVVCWGGSLTEKNRRRLDKLIRRAGSVLGRSLDSVGTVTERCYLRKVQSILDCDRHPLHHTLAGQESSRSQRLLSLNCRTERYRRSFIPTAIRTHNANC